MRLHESLTEMLGSVAGLDRHLRFIDGEDAESVLTFAGLRSRALDLLGALQRRGMAPGDELVIFTRSNEQFVIAFWAAVLGRIVPVPVAVGISDEHRLKLFRILGQMQRGILYTEGSLRERLTEFAGTQGLPHMLAMLEDSSVLIGDIEAGRRGDIVPAGAGDLAFIQYSSGSTSDPKGVCLTHRNLCTNIRAIVERLQFNADDQALSWMPLTHDMGLIGFHLSVMAAGMNHAVMDTGLFVRRPLLWMGKAGELRATQLCSPNFGYKHFLKLFERKGLPELDLSPVKLILNGAEPISWELCDEFLTALAPYGLKRTVMHPVYGLAEATVCVTAPEPGPDYGRITVDRHSLRIGDPYREADPDEAGAVSFMKCGHPVRDVSLRIADDADRELADGRIGHIQVCGDSVTGGLYHGDGPDDAERPPLFAADGWLRTGDVGVIVDGDLVITGRAKDIVIINGQNYYPHDLEEIVAAMDGFDLGKVVVCGVCTAQSQVEELVVFLLYRQDLPSFVPLIEEVRRRIGLHAGLEVAGVVPVTRIPKTTSGKVQRAQLAGAYLDGEFSGALQELARLARSATPGTTDGDPLVAELMDICREFAKERAIGPDDNLFESGVSSLTLTEIMLAFDERYPGKVDISDLFDHPTVREIAAFMRTEERAVS